MLIYEYQLNNKTQYALFSPVSDTFCFINATKEELFNIIIDFAKKEATRKLEYEFEKFEKGIPSQISKNVDDLKTDLRNHVSFLNCKDEEFNIKVKSLLEELNE